MLKSYKDLKVWQKSYELCLEIYRITAKFPKEERYFERIQGVKGPRNRVIAKKQKDSELGPLNKDISEIERMLKALIKSLENKPLNP